MDAWTTQIRRWPMVVIFICGEASNILCVLVLSGKQLRKSTCSRYLIGSSLSNSLCVFVGLPYFVLNNGFEYSVLTMNRGLCKILPYIYNSTQFLASWFILLACIDRYCSTHSRVTIRRFIDKNRAKWLLIFLPIITLIMHVHVLVYVDLTNDGQCNTTSFNYLLFFYLYYVVIYAFMTPSLYVVFAALTISNIRKTKKNVALVVQRNGMNIRPLHRQQTVDAQILRMLFVQVTSFVILTMPLAIWNIYESITFYQPKSADMRSLEGLLFVNFRFLTYTNVGSTCVIYAVSSRLFREELWVLFKCEWCKKIIKREQISTVFSIPRRITPI